MLQSQSSSEGNGTRAALEVFDRQGRCPFVVAGVGIAQSRKQTGDALARRSSANRVILSVDECGQDCIQNFVEVLANVLRQKSQDKESILLQ